MIVTFVVGDVEEVFSLEFSNWKANCPRNMLIASRRLISDSFDQNGDGEEDNKAIQERSYSNLR